MEFIGNNIIEKSVKEDYTISVKLGSCPLYPAELHEFIQEDTNWNLFETGEQIYYSTYSQYANYNFTVIYNNVDNRVIQLVANPL